MTPEVRLSPDRTAIAYRFQAGRWTIQRGEFFERYVSDEEVSDWTLLVPASITDRVTCPWCKKPNRKLTAAGTLRKHGKPNTFPPQDCDGSGLTLDHYEYIQELGRLHAAEDDGGAS